MNTFEISDLLTPDNIGLIDLVEAGQVVKAGFGGRSLEECIQDAQDHLQSAKLIQFAHSQERLVGFAMYETFNDHQDMYLNGIVIDKNVQARGLGKTMLTAAYNELQAEYLFAVTRNPALVGLIGKVCDFVQPSPGTTGTIPDSKFNELARLVGVPDTDMPYHRGRYPADLYDEQPKHTDPFTQKAFETFYDLNDISDGVMIVGGKNE